MHFLVCIHVSRKCVEGQKSVQNLQPTCCFRSSITVGLGCVNRRADCQEFDVDEVIEVKRSHLSCAHLASTQLTRPFVCTCLKAWTPKDVTSCQRRRENDFSNLKLTELECTVSHRSILKAKPLPTNHGTVFCSLLFPFALTPSFVSNCIFQPREFC